MRVLEVSAKTIKEAVEVLNSGGMVGYPTETFYGIAVRYDNEAALERLSALKGRPGHKPFSLIAGSIDIVRALAYEFSPAAVVLMTKHWPGPLTLILSGREGLSEYIAPKGTIAVRVPGPSPALELARAAGFAITATSANPSGELPASDAETVREYFRETSGDGLDIILDGGHAPGGLASTLVDTTGQRPVILRQGECEPVL